MKRIVYHIVVPAIMLVLFFAVATMPVDVVGCRMRGLIALLIALVSGLAALSAAIKVLKVRAQGAENAPWWVASALILTIPVVALLVLG